MRNTIQLKASDDSQYYDLKVQFTGEFESTQQPMTLERTATNKASLTVGLPYYMWRGVARLLLTPPANYATIAIFKAWATGGIAKRTMTMRDHSYPTSGVTWNVIFTSQWTPQYLSPVFDGSGSYILVPFELQQA